MEKLLYIVIAVLVTALVASITYAKYQSAMIADEDNILSVQEEITAVELERTEIEGLEGLETEKTEEVRETEKTEEIEEIEEIEEGREIQEIGAQHLFDVILKDAGASKISVVQIVKIITGLGLYDSKEIVDNGGIIKKMISKNEAEEVKAKLTEFGATVEIKAIVEGYPLFNVVLKDAGPSKISIVQIVKVITGLGLEDSKNLVDNGGIIKKVLSKEEAEEIKEKLSAAGAIVLINMK